MSDDSASSSRSRSPSVSDAEVSRFLQRLTPEQLAGLASRAQDTLSSHSSPARSDRSAPSASSRRSGRSRLSRASGPERGSSGRGCCADRDDVDPVAAQPIHSVRGTPSIASRSSSHREETPHDTPEDTPSSTPISSHRREVPEGYSYLVDPSGAIIMTPEGKEVISTMRHLCRQVFRHTVMKPWTEQRQDLKDYVIDTLHRDFLVPTLDDRFSRDFMLLHMREYMKHRRDDARSAIERPDWLDREEWRQIREDRTSSPDRWEQQRRAARARIDAGSSHHLGSGGWGSFHEDFVSSYT